MIPLISVIVPVYNVEQYLNICLDSILKQTYRNLEIILVDDGSPDNCGNICDEYALMDSRVKVIHKKNGGLSSARNAGIEICRGSFISFIDSDDFVSPYFIEMLYKGVQQYNADVVTFSSAFNFMDGDDDLVKLASNSSDCRIEKIEPYEALRQILYQKIPNGAPHRLYKREIFQTLRFPLGFLFEDVATVYKAFSNAKRMAIIYADAYAYRVRKNSIVRMKFSDKKMVSIPIGRELFDNINIRYPSLKKAAAARAFSLNYQILLQVPKYDQISKEKLWKEIIFYRKYILTDFDSYMRKKNRFAAIISFAGMNISYRIGRKIIYKT